MGDQTKSSRSRTRKRKFYTLSARYGMGFRLLNGDRLFAGGPWSLWSRGERGFREYPEAPIFLADAKLGPIGNDF